MTSSRFLLVDRTVRDEDTGLVADAIFVDRIVRRCCGSDAGLGYSGQFHPREFGLVAAVREPVFLAPYGDLIHTHSNRLELVSGSVADAISDARDRAERILKPCLICGATKTEYGRGRGHILQHIDTACGSSFPGLPRTPLATTGGHRHV